MKHAIMTKTEALDFAKKEAARLADGFYAGLTADDVATNVWDTLLSNGADQCDACEAVEAFYAAVTI